MRTATVVLGTPVGADDVVQQAGERAWVAIGTVRGPAFRPWFLRIVANCARNDLRAGGRRANLAIRVTNVTATMTPTTPEDEVVSQEDRDLVLAALNRLSSDDRLVLALRHFEGLSEAEMADTLDCARGTVKSRLSRATTRLRTALLAAGDRDR